MLVKLFKQGASLILRKMFEASLQDAAPVRMGRQFPYVALERRDKAEAFRSDALD